MYLYILIKKNKTELKNKTMLKSYVHFRVFSNHHFETINWICLFGKQTCLREPKPKYVYQFFKKIRPKLESITIIFKTSCKNTLDNWTARLIYVDCDSWLNNDQTTIINRIIYTSNYLYNFFRYDCPYYFFNNLRYKNLITIF